jgi:TRAP-type mannitol/chloroaromatic compound transport system permease large subunit
VKLASGVITAGGTLGILIPPSVMIIVYAAVAGQSVVKLYASAMFPGFFLSFLYLVYIIGWALIDPKIAPKSETKIPVSDWVRRFQDAYSRNMLVGLLRAAVAPRKAAGIEIGGRPMTYRAVLANLLAALFPLFLCAVTLWGIWWYVVIHPLADVQAPAPMAVPAQKSAAPAEKAAAQEDKPQELGATTSESESTAAKEPETLQEMGDPTLVREGGASLASAGPPPEFFMYFWIVVAVTALVLLWYYIKMQAEQFELLKLLTTSVMPLGILTLVVLAVILFGITTATESAAIGAAGAFLMGFHAKTLDWERVKQSIFLTAKTDSDGLLAVRRLGAVLWRVRHPGRSAARRAMGAVVQPDAAAVHDRVAGDHLRARMAARMDGDHRHFRADLPAVAQALQHRPDSLGTLVFVNLQAAFLSPPVAMSAFYLKGVSPPHVTLNQIFAGMMPYMFVVILCMVIMYVWPGMTLWLPNYLYGNAGG